MIDTQPLDGQLVLQLVADREKKISAVPRQTQIFPSCKEVSIFLL